MPQILGRASLSKRRRVSFYSISHAASDFPPCPPWRKKDAFSGVHETREDRPILVQNKRTSKHRSSQDSHAPIEAKSAPPFSSVSVRCRRCRVIHRCSGTYTTVATGMKVRTVGSPVSMPYRCSTRSENGAGCVRSPLAYGER